MKIEKKLVTPAIAIELLKNNTGNRAIKKPTLFRYSNEMKGGRWKEDTGELIKLNEYGKILDGQHRLRAVVHSGCSIHFHFAYDLSDEIFDVLDTGSLRNASDSFFISGIKNNNLIPSIITLNYSINTGGKDKNAQKNNKLSITQLLDEYNKKPLFWDEVSKKTINWYNNFSKIIAPSIIGGLYSIFKEKDECKADFFMIELCGGLNITNSSVNILRNILIKDKISIRKMQMDFKIAIIIKTWNLYRTNSSLKIIKWDSKVEKFPTIL